MHVRVVKPLTSVDPVVSGERARRKSDSPTNGKEEARLRTLDSVDRLVREESKNISKILVPKAPLSVTTPTLSANPREFADKGNS